MGLYLAVMAVCCLVSVLTCKETKDVTLPSDDVHNVKTPKSI